MAEPGDRPRPPLRQFVLIMVGMVVLGILLLLPRVLGSRGRQADLLEAAGITFIAGAVILTVMAIVRGIRQRR